MDEQMIADPSIEQIWELADVIRNASVDTPHGPRSVGYYISVGIDTFGHPNDRLQVLLNAAAKAALDQMAGKVAEQQQRIEAAFVKGADVAVFIANQRQNPQPPTGSQLDEIADFLAAVRDAL